MKFSTPPGYINHRFSYIEKNKPFPDFPPMPDKFDVEITKGTTIVKFGDVYVEEVGNVLHLFDDVEPAVRDNGLHYCRVEWLGYVGRNPWAQLYNATNCSVVVKRKNMKSTNYSNNMGRELIDKPLHEILIVDRVNFEDVNSILHLDKLMTSLNLIILVDYENNSFLIYKNRWGKQDITLPLNLLSTFLFNPKITDRSILTKLNHYENNQI